MALGDTTCGSACLDTFLWNSNEESQGNPVITVAGESQPITTK